MKNYQRRFNVIILLLALLTLISCKKFLDAKPDVKLTTPSKVTDLQMLLDDYTVMNKSWPAALEVQADNYYMTFASWNGLYEESWRNLYRWIRDETKDVNYRSPFAAIMQSNVVLDESKEIKFSDSERTIYDNTIGSAYFFRAFYYHSLSQLFIKPYSLSSAKLDLGLPLRSNADINVKSKRSTVEETYQFILSDLKRAVKLLPNTALVRSRPSRPAAYGLLARTYLYMNDFANAKLYADSCLAIQSDLIDYNSLDKTSIAPFQRFNKEVIFHVLSFGSEPFYPNNAIIDNDLYDSYGDKDLRKSIFFHDNGNDTYIFKGDYDGQGIFNYGDLFGGLATDEVLLIRAEARVRTGDILGGMQDLNKLLITRWEAGSFTPFNAISKEDALKTIILERRKELVYRGARWSDIRRLTGIYQIVPKRTLGDKMYTLEPGSDRYTMPFPIEVIERSGMPQNP